MGTLLAGRFFYSDAVNTLIVVMSVVGNAVGLTQGQWLMTSVLLTVVAIISASFGWGFLVDRFGRSKR